MKKTILSLFVILASSLIYSQTSFTENNVKNAINEVVGFKKQYFAKKIICKKGRSSALV